MGKQDLGVGESLAELFPSLAIQWHPFKNSPSTPESVRPRKAQKVWWICEKGHEWESPIGNRLLGYGCLICSNKQVLIGFNDLETTHPEIAKQWHPNKNGNLTPREVVSGSKKKVWWICEKGHEWEASITHRAKGSACLVCLNKKVLVGVNDLTTTHPLLEKQWDYIANFDLKPSMITGGYSKKVFWKCDFGHEFSLAPSERTRRQNGSIGLCPVCDNRILLPGVNDLESQFPDLAKEWDHSKNSKSPSELFSRSGKKAWWICENEHSWLASLSNRTRGRGTGCPVCTKVQFMPGFNDLSTTHPNLAAQWDVSKNSITPAEVTSGYPVKVWWLCNLGHSFDAKVSARVGQQSGCPFCTNQKVLVGFNDLGTTHPELASEIVPELNSGITPQEVTAGSNVVFNWRCNEGHVTSKSVVFRAKTQKCSVCSNYQLEVGNNDLASVSPHLISEIAESDFNPSGISAFSEKKISWSCPLGHVYRASIRNRTQQMSGCGVCSGQTVLAGFNDLRTRLPEILGLWNYERNLDVQPEEVTPFSVKRVWWQCDQGHEWQSMISNISSGSGCPACAPGGFDQSKPGILYFIQNKEMRANKIGITNQGIRTLRIKHFEKLGWKRIDEHPIQSGIQTRQVETTLLHWIRRDLSLPPYLSKEELKSGWRETFSMDAMTDKEISEKITQVIRETNLSD